MRNKGQNLMEFLIILGLVVLAGLLTLTLFGNNIKEMFSKSHKEYNKFEPFGNKIPQSGTINVKGNIDVTYKYNDKGNLDITLDGFTFKDLPADFYDLVQTAGSSGGTTVLADLIQALADQLSASGDMPEEEIQILKDMASKAKQMALIEKQIETISQGVVDFCSNQPNGQACAYEDFDVEAFDDLVTTLVGDNGHGGLNAELRDFIGTEDYVLFQEKYPQSSIMVQLLSDEINSIANYMYINHISINDNDYDKEGLVRIFNAQDILTPGFENPDKITDIDGSLICNIGNGSYNPEACH